ncbi:MAG: flavin reductase [Acetobacter sp.]|nr:flavin reductase [Acetobacter sp.]
MTTNKTIAYRDAMARLGAAVTIVTTGTLENPVGFTASAVCSVTDTPPTLLVCLNRQSRSRAAFYEGAAMCVNVLSDVQQNLANHFSSPNTMQKRFDLGAWETMITGAPALVEALVSLDCTISHIVEVGTHSVMFGTVRALCNHITANGLVYFNRTYHSLQHTPKKFLE